MPEGAGGSRVDRSGTQTTASAAGTVLPSRASSATRPVISPADGAGAAASPAAAAVAGAPGGGGGRATWAATAAAKLPATTASQMRTLTRRLRNGDWIVDSSARLAKDRGSRQRRGRWG